MIAPTATTMRRPRSSRRSWLGVDLALRLVDRLVIGGRIGGVALSGSLEMAERLSARRLEVDAELVDDRRGLLVRDDDRHGFTPLEAGWTGGRFGGSSLKPYGPTSASRSPAPRMIGIGKPSGGTSPRTDWLSSL